MNPLFFKKSLENTKYRDIEHLMPKVDVFSILEKIGAKGAKHVGPDRVSAYCPDHNICCGRVPSHPKWTINTKTGATYCFTEGRASNLLFTIKRCLGCDLENALDFMLGGATNCTELSAAKIKNDMSSYMSVAEEIPEVSFTMAEKIESEIRSRPISPRVYEFFMHPIGKKFPTNILPDTVNSFKVFERSYGHYTDRAIVPFFDKNGRVNGFAAIDLLGEEEWNKRNLGKKRIDENGESVDVMYRKVLYPSATSGFKSGSMLFGIHSCDLGADYIVLTEGVREVMKLRQEGIKNCVAVLGANLSDTQIEVLSQKAPKKIITMFDGDSAGVKASNKISVKVGRFFDVGVVEVPEGKDPKNLDGDDIRRLIKEQTNKEVGD